MLCPTCVEVRLLMTERSGIEIDYCPTCRGVWLDRGELDKLIDRAGVEGPLPMPAPAVAPRRDDERERELLRREYDRGYNREYKRDDDDKRDREWRDGDYKKKRKKSFLSDLFEFGD